MAVQAAYPCHTFALPLDTAGVYCVRLSIFVEFPVTCICVRYPDLALHCTGKTHTEPEISNRLTRACRLYCHGYGMRPQSLYIQSGNGLSIRSYSCWLTASSHCFSSSSAQSPHIMRPQPRASSTTIRMRRRRERTTLCPREDTQQRQIMGQWCWSRRQTRRAALHSRIAQLKRAGCKPSNSARVLQSPAALFSYCSCQYICC